MATRNALFRKILENPDDDAPRLAFADWLEQQDEKDRAEYIRLQIAQSPATSPSLRVPLFGGGSWTSDLQPRDTISFRFQLDQWKRAERLREIEDTWAEKWREELPKWAREKSEFRRGFIDSVEVKLPDLISGAEALFSAAPLSQLTVQACWHLRWMPAFVQLPGLRHVRQLTMNVALLGDAEMALFGSSPLLKNLRTLSLTNNRIGPDGLVAFGAQGGFPHLHSLSLTSNPLGVAGRFPLERSAFPSLRSMCLDDCGLNADSIDEMGRRGWFAQLSVMNLARNKTMDADAVAALTQCPDLGCFVCLDLSGCPIGDDGACVLGEADHLVRLRKLGINGHRGSEGKIGDRGFAALIASEELAGLETLWLRSNNIGAEGLAASANESVLARIQHLDLAWNPLTDDGVRALAGSAYVSSLRSLNLCETRLTDEAMIAVAQSSHFTHLESLELRTNQITDRGAVELAQSPYFRRLKRLDLSSNQLTDYGALALAEAGNFPALRSLGVYCDGVSEKIRKRIGKILSPSTRK